MRNRSTSSKGKDQQPCFHLFAVLALGLTIALLPGCRSGQSALADKSLADMPPSAVVPAEASMAATREIAVPAGTVFSVRLLQNISSASAHSGDEFDGELTHAVTMKGREVFRKGTPILGRVVSAKESGRLQDPGRLRLALKAIQGRNGDWIMLTSSSFSVQGGSHKNRNLTLIGGGTGVGALIGGIAGGGKGAAIGALSGAAAGTAGAAATGEKNVTLHSEHVLRFTLKHPILVQP